MMGKRVRGRLFEAVPLHNKQWWHERMFHESTTTERVEGVVRAIRMAVKAQLQWGKRA